MAEVVDASAGHGIDPWLVHEDERLAIRCFDRRAGSAPDLVTLSPSLAGIPFARMRQVHGSTVVLVDDLDGGVDPSEADALVAFARPTSLIVRTADCVPLVLWDHTTSAVAVVHVGWRGLVAGIVPATITSLVGHGVAPEGIRAWIGPYICSGCYPVGHDVQGQIVAAASAAEATSRTGEPAADVGAGVIEQLRALGVQAITVDGRCTREFVDLFSARGGDATDRLQFVATVS